MPCLTKRGKYSAYFVVHVGLRGFLAQRLEAQRVEQQARGDEDYAGSFSISVRAASTTHLRTSSIGTPS